MSTNMFNLLNRYYPNKTNYVDIENLHPVSRDCRIRNRRLLPTLLMAPKRRVTLVVATGNNQPLLVCLATQPASGSKWPGLRGLWRSLCSNCPRLAQASRWREIVGFGLDRRRHRFVGNAGHCFGLDKPNIGFDFLGCLKKPSLQELTHHV